MDIEINSLQNLPEHDFWKGLPLEVQHGINNAKSDLDRGEGIPHVEVMAEMKRVFLKGRQ
jgi:hypothetical protein